MHDHSRITQSEGKLAEMRIDAIGYSPIMKPEHFLEIKDTVQVLDVRLQDDYEACHLKGAANNCVHEVSFVDRLVEAAPEKRKLTVIYGENSKSHEAAAAFEKMLRAGYSDIHILEGGIEAAIRAGLDVIQGRSAEDAQAIRDGVYLIDKESSKLSWTGRNLLNKHTGTVGLAHGKMKFEQGCLTTGEFLIDLARLECDDLLGTDMHDVLVAHLHNDDFLDLEKYPDAHLIITKSERIPDAGIGAPNLHIKAGLMIKGQTHPIELDAVSGITPEGKPAAQAVFSIDRTRWGIIYGSGKFFHRLGGHLVNDLIDFEVKIVGTEYLGVV
ncbi:YceI family protein [Luteolibacter sp. AS25]|uniref:YceI family protein n=1 Tax=Luteolibacter sp. AS25 TaxID=3135776 RepID=UPI00398B05E1